MVAAKNSVTTTVEQLPESRVHVAAEVTAKELKRRMNEAAAKMGRELRVDGFRAGKVPPALVIQRYGREVVLDEAVRNSIGYWYMEAIEDAAIVPIGDPEIDLGEIDQGSGPLKFSFEVGVRPTATLGDISTLAVQRREPNVSDDAIDAELEQMRQQAGRLETVERAAAEGDYVVIDFTGYTGSGETRTPFEGGEGRDHLLEIGGGRFIPGFEEQLVGLTAGEEKVIAVTFPEQYEAAEHLAGQAAEFEVLVHEVKGRSLPELDDDFAADSGGFDTLAELREDIESRLLKQDREQVENELREAVLDAVVEQAELEIPADLTRARAHAILDQMTERLARSGLTKEAYLQMSGQSEEEMLTQALPDAEQTLAREAVLAAVIDAEQIVPSEGEMLEALTQTALEMNSKPEKLRKQLERNGRLDDLREDLAQRRAVELLVERIAGAEEPTAN